MLVALICFDKPGAEALRAETRASHLDYVRASGPMVRIAGPFQSDDGARMIGSLIVLECETLERAREWAANDPYAKAGLFAETRIHPWRFVIENGAPRA